MSRLNQWLGVFILTGLMLSGCGQQVASRIDAREPADSDAASETTNVELDAEEPLALAPVEPESESVADSSAQIDEGSVAEANEAQDEPASSSPVDAAVQEPAEPTVTPAKFTSTSESAPTEPAERKTQIDLPTHRQLTTIQPKLDGKPIKMNTFCVAADGRLLAACGGEQQIYVPNPDGSYEVTNSSAPPCVIVFDSKGKQIDRWDVEFKPTAINTSPSGEIFVAGEGKLVRMSAAGKILASGDSPILNDLEAFEEKAKKQAKAQAAQFAEMFSDQLDAIKKRIAKIEAVEESERSRIQKAQLSAFNQQLEFYEQMAENGAPGAIGPEALMAQAKGITSIAASDEDVFIVCRSAEGNGYGIWRTNHEFADGEVVVDGVSGCCGQMDIQCCEGNLVIAENGSFKVAIYDRFGRAVTSFGSRDRSSKTGFGSCCNPMNTCPMEDGTILTAESSIGHIKRFDQDGNLVAYIGRAKVGGGCKHCAMGYDPSTDQYYMMHEDANKICVLANRKNMPTQTEDDLRIARMRAEFDGRLLGTWQFASVTKDAPKAEGEEQERLLGALIGDFNGQQAGFDKVSLKSDGSLDVEGGIFADAYSEWSFEPVSADGNAVRLQLYGDQSEFGVLTFDLGEQNAAKVSIAGLGMNQETNATRTHTCDGKPCDEECHDEEKAKPVK